MSLSKPSQRPDRLSLRERGAALTARLADVKKRATLAVKVARVVATPPAPEPEPPNRVVLIDYATWLYHERKRVCAELYPHRGVQASAFVLGLNAGEDWHFHGRDRSGGWAEKPPATARAIQVLDLVGVDWRADMDGGPVAIEASVGHDTGVRPALPCGWPAPDAALVAALADLRRLDALLATVRSHDGRDLDELPEYRALDEARDEAIDTLASARAEGLTGLQAKAAAFLSHSFREEDDNALHIARGLARDLTGASQRHLLSQPDPAMSAIEECRRLDAIHGAALAISGTRPTGDPSHGPERDAYDALWAHWDGVVLKTVPTTARGCGALARYTVEFLTAQGLEEHRDAVLSLIARSPLL